MTTRTLALAAVCALLCGCNIINSIVHDDQVIARCNDFGIAMAFTGIRLFHH